jgi:diketogulonate reductase-like aldo/keto reductase
LDVDRRQFLTALVGGTLTLSRQLRATPIATPVMLTRPVPRSAHAAEALPVIGMGTYDTFDVGHGMEERKPLIEVMRLFVGAGGRVIDSSPMYGRSEEVVGDVLVDVEAPQMFLATKVWIQGKQAGIDQMERSMKLMGGRIDLMQIHNLLDWRTHLATLRDWKAAGKIRYIGITHYELGAAGEMERIIAKENIDFVQLPYSVGVREAEKRLLPAAADNRVAVLVMRPFEKGGLFGKVKDRPLPAFAADCDCTSWAQLFLKWIIAHPAVTAVIPATSNPKHAADDLKAGFGRLPSAELRGKIVAAATT